MNFWNSFLYDDQEITELELLVPKVGPFLLLFTDSIVFVISTQLKAMKLEKW